MRLGHQTGFDSGSTLDYVYRNEAVAACRWWALPSTAPTSTRSAGAASASASCTSKNCCARPCAAWPPPGRPVRVTDIAAGHGRYVLDAVTGSDVKPQAVVLRDYSDINVRDGRALIEAKGLQGVARFDQADAFDRASLAAIDPKPTSAWSRACTSCSRTTHGGPLAGRPGRGHPARRLPGLHRPALAPAAGADRPRADQPPPGPGLGDAPPHARPRWTSWWAAGFRKLAQRIDEWGIFSVSLAQRVAVTEGAASALPHRPWRRALAWLARPGAVLLPELRPGQPPGGCACRGAQPRVRVGTLDPVLDWTIFPYWSVNAFYGLSLLLARSRHELDRHGARLLTAQCRRGGLLHRGGRCTSASASPRPHGAAGLLFAALRGFDQPFNQAPSLHIALVVILWDLYRRLIHGRIAPSCCTRWTLAICISVLTTYQHHFIDIPTGALLGVFCVWAWPLERRVSMPRRPGNWPACRAGARWRALCHRGAGCWRRWQLDDRWRRPVAVLAGRVLRCW
jgi:hypothetical protein